MIGIRADANRIIATGHVMRCITIAKEIVMQGETVTFFVADEESRELVNIYASKTPGIETVVLGTDWQDMENEIPVLRRELKERGISVLLVDSYQVSVKYFEELRGICPVAYMDDLGKESYPVDMLINYSGYYEVLGYKEMYRDMSGHGGAPTELLLGLSYAPLRQQFYDGDLILPKGNDRPDILIASGGADQFHMLSGILGALKDKGLIALANYKVVVGNMVSDIEVLESFCADNETVEILKNVSNMAQLMRNCDLAVTAAGTMLTECAASTLPVIYYQVADNQKYNVEFWQKTGGMVFAGDVSGSEADRIQTLNNITDQIQVLLEDPGRLGSMKRMLTGLTDGRGAVRIAKALLTR